MCTGRGQMFGPDGGRLVRVLRRPGQLLVSPLCCRSQREVGDGDQVAHRDGREPQGDLYHLSQCSGVCGPPCVPVEIPVVGTVQADIAWGGMFYAIADAAQFGLALTPDEGRDIGKFGEMLTLAAREQYPVHHPLDSTLAGVTISQLSGSSRSPENHRRNAVTMSTGNSSWDRQNSFIGCIDRSPCGTGTSARMATMHARGQLDIGEEFRHERVIGTVFVGRLIDIVQLGDVKAVVPEITGHAWVTGFANYVLDSSDPFPTGFTDRGHLGRLTRALGALSIAACYFDTASHSGSGRGTDLSRAVVYGSRGRLRTSSVGPDSTTRPLCMT